MSEQQPDKPSNWGRWGATDERGTLNLLTPAIVQRAAGLVTCVFSRFLVDRTPTPAAAPAVPPVTR